MRAFSPMRLVFLFLGGAILLFLVAPVVGLYLDTSPAEFFNTATEDQVAGSIWLTLRTSMIATFFSGIAAVPFSWLLARRRFPFRKIISAIIDVPIVIPSSAAGIAILGFVSRDTLVGRVGEGLGISFVGNTPGIIIAMAFVSIPFLINSARDGFAAVPERLEKAALNLGASPSRVFFTISLPLAWRSILSGFIMMWARGMSEFGAIVIIAYHPMVTPVLIWERFTSFGLAWAKPVTVVFITICLLFFVILRLLSSSFENAED